MRTENLIKDGEREIGGTQKLYRFDNGFGASVIQGYGTYGNEDGLYELAVIEFDSKDDDNTWSLTYDTSITDDVIGYLTEESVDTLLTKIEALNKYGKLKGEMTEEVYNGHTAISAILNEYEIWDYNSTRIFVNGKEVQPDEVEIVIYKGQD